MECAILGWGISGEERLIHVPVCLCSELCEYRDTPCLVYFWHFQVPSGTWSEWPSVSVVLDCVFLYSLYGFVFTQMACAIWHPLSGGLLWSQIDYLNSSYLQFLILHISTKNWIPETSVQSKRIGSLLLRAVWGVGQQDCSLRHLLGCLDVDCHWLPDAFSKDGGYRDAASHWASFLRLSVGVIESFSHVRATSS